MAAAAKELVVFGGNGLLGQAICRAAVARGFQVTSVSRRGSAPGGGGGGRGSAAWTQRVTWAQGDALDPSSYRDRITERTRVVHTVGTLMENDGYKKLLRSEPQDAASYGGATYEVVNRDTATRVAETAADAGAPFLLFVSAATAPPGVDRRYITTKREAETVILGLDAPLRSVVFRPGFMYTEEEPATLVLGASLLTASRALGFLKARVALAAPFADAAGYATRTLLLSQTRTPRTPSVAGSTTRASPLSPPPTPPPTPGPWPRFLLFGGRRG